MTTYKLTATTDWAERTKTFGAPDDREAVAWGALLVVGEAIADPVWAKGAIKLTGPDGTVIKTMDAKAA